MLNEDANKTLNFCPIFINLGLLEAELSYKTGNMFRFYLCFIRITQSKSKDKEKKYGVKISNSVNILASNWAMELKKKSSWSTYTGWNYFPKL